MTHTRLTVDFSTERVTGIDKVTESLYTLYMLDCLSGRKGLPCKQEYKRRRFESYVQHQIVAIAQC